MTVYIVLFHGSVVGLYSCVTDAACVAKALPQSSLVSCKLDQETDTGTMLLANVSVAGLTR